MKNLTIINEIIANLEDEVFERINEAETEMWLGETAKDRRNAKKRLAYNLNKNGLTIDEYIMWCAN